GVLPVRRSRIDVLHMARSRSAGDVVQATRQPFDPGSSTHSCATAGFAVLRGGALEPGASCLEAKSQDKADGIHRRVFLRTSSEGPFSLRRGLEHVLVFLKLSIPSLHLGNWS